MKTRTIQLAVARRLKLVPTVREMLPADPVHEELMKPVLASILRLYPLPRGYILKAGELYVDEKSRLSPLVTEEISKLGKIINCYTDVTRPLISYPFPWYARLRCIHCNFCFTINQIKTQD